MENVWNALKDISYSGVPVVKILAVLFVLIAVQTLRGVVVSGILKSVERLTQKTQSTLDDELITIIKPALSWLILVAGFWVIKTILAEYLGAQLSEAIDKTLNLITLFIVAYVLYRSAAILGQLIANIVLQTETELDQMLRPLMPKIFQAVAIIVLTIKISEIFLGQSAAALVGLLGGAGITLGLLFKDIVYDWFCTLIIYSDGLFKEGDWIAVSGVDGFVQVLNVGFRTTSLHVLKWGSILKMPNSRMISGIVENWSQNPGDELKWGLALELRVDAISAQQSTRLLEGLEKILKSTPGLCSSCIVRFKKIEQNARVFEIIAWVNDDNLYFDAEKQINLSILELLEQEGIDFLHVELETRPEQFKQGLLQASQN